MGDSVRYIMQSRGGTRGSVTGVYRRWVPEQVIVAPDGEFRHIPRDRYRVENLGAYETRPMRPAPVIEMVKEEPKPEKKPAAKKRPTRTSTTKRKSTKPKS